MTRAGTARPIEDIVCDRIERERDELVALAVSLGGTPSPHGQELVVATDVARWLRAEGLPARLQPITATSANVVSRTRGVAAGPSLLLNAHLDTGAPVAIATSSVDRAWHDKGVLYGAGLVNDKAQLAALLVAYRAVAGGDVPLGGDLLLAATAFETGRPSVPGRAGIDHPGEGFGAFWLVNRGVIADYALVAETSGFGIIEVEAGAAVITITVRGRGTYTPRLERDVAGRVIDNAIVTGTSLVHALDDWCATYEQHALSVVADQVVAPRAQIVAVHGSASAISLELDVRLVPDASPMSVVRDLEALLSHLQVVAEVELVQWSRGHRARDADALRDALHASHERVHGSAPPRPPVAETSMWRDMNAFNELGIAALCYGPPRRPEPYTSAGDRSMLVDDLVAATKVYALTALRTLGVCDG